MATFRDREKRRLIPLKERLFSAPACVAGTYKRLARDFALNEEHSVENLWTGIRANAIAYFHRCGIGWHDGLAEPEYEDKDAGRRLPSNHLCCSQTCCVNFWFPFAKSPLALTGVLKGIGYDVEEMLPIHDDEPLPSGEQGFVGLEWIGRRNYLAEGPGGNPTPDEKRSRGANATSADFVLRFRQPDGKIRVVLGEWKYTEHYANDRSIQHSRRGTDRLAIYRPKLAAEGCPIRLGNLPPESLFYDPFDQLMRLQLLAAAMEREREMDADIVSVLHVAPSANRELMTRITSPRLRDRGDDIHAVWSSLVAVNHFRGVSLEELLNVASQNVPDPDWLAYMNLRYGGIA